VAPYVKEKYKIILLDFIFQGQSEKETEWRDFDKHAEDVKSVLDKEGISNVNVIGLSYGSIVAQHFALLFPNRINKLILLSTFAHKTPYFEAIGFSWTRALEMGGYNLLLDVMLPNVLSENYFNNPLVPLELMKEARKGANENSTALLKLMQATAERKDYRSALNNIKSSTLIIHGEKDLLIPVHMANEVHINIPGSQFYIISNAGHTLNLESIPEVMKQIIPFLEK
jgi:pimeloyl-ACP methyl ester carboxylesterase